MGQSGVEEAAGAKEVVASNRPVGVTWADGHRGIVSAFGIMGAGAIATASGVVITSGPGAVGLTGKGGRRDILPGSISKKNQFTPYAPCASKGIRREK